MKGIGVVLVGLSVIIIGITSVLQSLTISKLQDFKQENIKHIKKQDDLILRGARIMERQQSQIDTLEVRFNK